MIGSMDPPKPRMQIVIDNLYTISLTFFGFSFGALLLTAALLFVIHQPFSHRTLYSILQTGDGATTQTLGYSVRPYNGGILFETKEGTEMFLTGGTIAVQEIN